MDFAEALNTFKDELGIKGGRAFTKREREIIYGAAFGKYEGGCYEQAAEYFTMLVMHDPYETRFWKGLASSYQMDRKYHEALKTWAIYALLSGHSADGHFHAAECYLSLDEMEEAKKALAMAEKFVDGNSITAHRIQTLRSHLHG